MDILETIKNRRSIRTYQDKKVSKTDIDEILYYATLAPSARNKQPWLFIVINEDDKMKNEIANIMIKKANMSAKIDPTILATANTIKEAPVLILIFNKFNDLNLVSNTLSIGACIQNMLLIATNLGLGSLWIRNTYIAEKEICAMLDKEDMSLASAVAIGYANESPNARPRLKVEEITEWK